MHSAPEYLVVGHVTRDLLPDGGHAAGGTALYAATTALRLGLRTALLTATAEDLEPLLPGCDVLRTPARVSSTFENRYRGGAREQWLHAVAPTVDLTAVPTTWRDAACVHLGPVAQEFPIDALYAFGESRIVVTPQGWLRAWGSSLPARVTKRPWHPHPEWLSRVNLLVLSTEDIDNDEAIVARYAEHCPLLALTRGAAGLTLFEGGKTWDVPAVRAEEVDPTGAGDVFAAAMLIRLQETGSPDQAARFATAVAAASVEGPAWSQVPTRAAAVARLSASL